MNNITKELIINKNNLIIIHINSRRLNKNLDIKRIYRYFNIKLHIICLSETWLNGNNDFNNNIANYKYQTKYRQTPNKYSGGVTIYFLKDIQHELIK